MWISKWQFEQILNRVYECEEKIKNLEHKTDIRIRKIAKRILEQPEELLEEINGIEDIERFIDEFIHS